VGTLTRDTARQSTHQRFVVADSADVGAVRRTVDGYAAQLLIDPQLAAVAAQTATELATNLLRHADPGGWILARPLPPHGVELLAVDRGPGIRDVAAAVEGRSPAPKGLGCGLAAVHRASSYFDIHTRPDRGTVVLAVVTADQHRRARVARAPRRWAGISVGIDEPCGDGWVVTEEAGALTVAVVDGLGHGPNASIATDAALNALADHPGDLERYLRLANAELRHTRGVDWSNPHGATFELAVARRPARKPAERVGTLVFGPGGPGDSGVERIRRGNRFSAEILDRFDTVSFDPRGVARSGGAACPSDPGLPAPPGLLASQSDFDATIAYNRAMWASCRATSPVFDHADTLSAVRDLDALRNALGLQKLTFHGSSYGTLLGELYAERYPGRVRAIVLESVFDHSLDVRDFVRTQALALQDAFDEFVAWCATSIDCALHGSDVRAVWNDVLDRADQGEYAPNTAFELAILPIALLAAPDRVSLSNAIAALRDGKAPRITLPPLVSSVFCADWPADVRDYKAYASLVRDAAAVAPDVRYGGGLLAVRACLGWPSPVANPPHQLHVRTTTPLLLLNSVHDVRTGYVWATNVAAQLGRPGRLVTYEGSGHGAYGNTPCTTAMIDRYLIDLIVPPPGARCPAAEA